MKIITWNVNGIRAIFRKNFIHTVKELKPDILCLQETKIQENQLTEEIKSIPGYNSVWSFAEKKGYSGTAVYYQENIKPKTIKTDFSIPDLDGEGRIIEIELNDFVLFNIYFPNGQMNDERLEYKLKFYESLFSYTDSIKENGKGIIICGDYNTAHKEIDLANPKENENRSGFLPVEREWLDHIVERGYKDIFRKFHQEKEQYTWWTYRFQAREKNIGWRIDYFFGTEDVLKRITDCRILKEIMGSDHCPVSLDFQ